jgi:hypothetical protein
MELEKKMKKQANRLKILGCFVDESGDKCKLRVD